MWYHERTGTHLAGSLSEQKYQFDLVARKFRSLRGEAYAERTHTEGLFHPPPAFVTAVKKDLEQANPGVVVDGLMGSLPRSGRG